MGSPLSQWSWDKATLPTALGGVGLRSAASHASAAYVGSVSQSESLITELIGGSTPPVDMSEAVALLSSSAERPDWSSIEEINISLIQKPLSEAIDKALYARLLESAASPRDRGLLRSTALPKAGVWLTAMPSPVLGLHLRDTDCRNSLRYWLGVPIFSPSTSCSSCEKTTDVHGDHQVGCGEDGDRIHRHNLIRDTLFSAARTAALGPLKEASGIVVGSMSRPADIYLPYWQCGRPAALDVTVVSPLQKALISQAATTDGHALSVAVRRKMRDHDIPCHEAGVDFIPLAVETLGGWCEEAMVTIKGVARAQGLRLGTPPHEASPRLFQKLAIALWRGNSALWARRAPVHPTWVDGVR